jgi:tRNA(Ile)-lysidine synthase
LIKKVIHTIKSRKLLEKGEKITVALSGGADSVALLRALIELGYNVNCVHINHLIRGSEAERDENFCRDLCNKLGIELRIERINIPEISSKLKKGLEETARNERYRVFSGIENKVATAHNMDDNAETILLHLIRGSSLKGLCGIPYQRGQIIRPLLDCKKSEILEFLGRKNQEFVTDSTNFSTDYTRNKIRLELIPLIKELNPKITYSLCKLAENARKNEEYLENITKNTDKNNLKKLPEIIRKRIISDFLENAGVSVNYGKINDADRILLKTGKLTIPKGRK